MAGTSSHTCCSPSTSTYSNPVINQDFPDPNCIKVADTFYVFATNFGEMEASRSHVQLATTNDLVTYQLQPDALPKLPSWAKTGKTWAPNVTHVHTTDGSLFVLYFVARDTQSDKQAIGVATSKNPEGPYQSHDPAPVIIQADQGGSIDSSVFTDSNGKRWLLFKNDGNAVNQATYIYLRPLSSDALQFAGDKQVLIQNDQRWEGKVIEAPFMWKHAGRYYLFYSGNSYQSPEYAVGYAVADHITGPYHKHPQSVLKSDGAVVGPGACCIVRGPNDTEWMLYHSWNKERTYRAMSIAELTWHEDKPVIRASWGEPQPAPFS